MEQKRQQSVSIESGTWFGAYETLEILQNLFDWKNIKLCSQYVNLWAGDPSQGSERICWLNSNLIITPRLYHPGSHCHWGHCSSHNRRLGQLQSALQYGNLPSCQRLLPASFAFTKIEAFYLCNNRSKPKGCHLWWILCYTESLHCILPCVGHWQPEMGWKHDWPADAD